MTTTKIRAEKQTKLRMIDSWQLDEKEFLMNQPFYLFWSFTHDNSKRLRRRKCRENEHLFNSKK